MEKFLNSNPSKKQLIIWKREIDKFLKDNLKIELHSDKSRIINLSGGIDFVGFRNFYYHRLLRKRNIKNMQRKINLFNKKEMSYEKLFKSFNGWNGYAKWANCNNLYNKIIKSVNISKII